MTRRGFFLCLTLALGLCAPTFGADKPAKRPVPEIERALIISCDGLRPDLLLRANTPVMHKLMESGSYSFWAQTVPMCNTLPSHTSMLTGVTVERHGITWNDDRPDAGYPKVPTIFELAKKAGYSTAIVTGKSKFITLNKPETVDWASIAGAADEDVAKAARAVIEAHKPEVMFLHFPAADRTGHGSGWGSKQQIKAIEEMDKAMGTVLEELEEQGLLKSTVIILSADHGGAGRTHLPSDHRSRHIPWIISGPGIRKDYDLTGDITLLINTEDTFATACYLLGIETDDDIDGKPIVQAVANRELLQDNN